MVLRAQSSIGLSQLVVYGSLLDQLDGYSSLFPPLVRAKRSIRMLRSTHTLESKANRRNHLWSSPGNLAQIDGPGAVPTVE